jgi:hypothetical protein
MPDKSAEISNREMLIWAVLVWAAILFLLWLATPDTRKMSDEQYMIYQMENNRQYP